MSILALAAVTAHDAADYGDEEAVFPPFNPEFWESQAFWLIISFTLLYLFLSRLVLPRIGATIERRSSRIAADLDEAARLNEEAEAAQQALQVEMARARAEARETAAKAQARIEAEIAERTVEADEAIEQKLAEAEATIAGLRADAMSKVEDIAAETARAMASRFGASVSQADASQAVRDVIAGRS